MKMNEYEEKVLADTIAREDISNLKIIQKVLNREINYRMDNMQEVACTKAVPALGYCTDVPSVRPKMEKKMNTANSMAIVSTAETVEERRISFLVSQLESAKSRKETELRRHFGLIEDEPPRTPTELVERIKDGLYVIPEHYKDQRTSYMIDYMEWRNPKIKKDQAGYDKAEKEMLEEARDVNRTIVLSEPDKGRAALEKFEKAKFH